MLKRTTFRERGTLWTTLSTGLVGPLNRFVERIVRHNRRRKAIAELSALSDELLADIGVTRDEIPETVDRIERDGHRAPTGWNEKPAVPSSQAVEELRRAA